MKHLSFGLCLLVMLSCRGKDTGVLVSLSIPADTTIEQLRIKGSVDGVQVIAPGVMPEPPRALKRQESFTLLLGSDLANQRMTVRIDGMHDGVAVASAVGDVDVLLHQMAPLSLALGAVAFCGDGQTVLGLEDCDDGNLRGGDGCSAECRIESGFYCLTAPNASSICTEGCGSGGPCASGQRCQEGQCICDARTCPTGCCDGNVCQPGTDANACGSAGSKCASCPASESCNAGACSGCLAGCLDGCCAGSTCLTPSLNNCGVVASACIACSPATADGCGVDGACHCGAGAACAAGQQCVNGSCGCNASSCANGCCSNGVCVNALSSAQCGTAGSECIACAAGDNCVGGTCNGCLSSCAGCCSGSTCVDAPTFPTCANAQVCVSCDPVRADRCGAGGECACGDNAACAVGQKCESGQCACDPASCDGCCQGNACVRAADTNGNACGQKGESCSACPSNKPCCSSGACRPGNCSL